MQQPFPMDSKENYLQEESKQDVWLLTIMILKNSHKNIPSTLLPLHVDKENTQLTVNISIRNLCKKSLIFLVLHLLFLDQEIVHIFIIILLPSNLTKDLLNQVLKELFQLVSEMTRMMKNTKHLGMNGSQNLQLKLNSQNHHKIYNHQSMT